MVNIHSLRETFNHHRQTQQTH